ncbi:hypothetical protein EUX98_g6988 [Antrodiella citrinella]|uniref:DUF6533 domain-containing protein n=1 Tax=Antrodiella citrinella TaxID=2447956 RepID=A0A4S4MV36_9APHY|nr:hypothetical protein EUX98_g6988 [Antrodiella citrinella]
MADAATAAFLDAAKSKQVVTYLDLVAAAVLAYDYILNIGDEAQYIWFSPFSLGKSLYFLTRYPVIVDTSLVLYHQFAVLHPGQCDVLFKVIGYLLGVGTLIAESILVMRTWVIWNRSVYIGSALIIGLIVCWIPVFYFLAQSLNSLVFADPPIRTPGCFLHSQKNILFVVFLIITGFESVILVLTLIRFTPHWRRKKTALIETIYRDGLFNYVYLCILSVCNVVVLLTAPVSKWLISHQSPFSDQKYVQRGYSTLLSALQRVMHSILSSRVLLNLRQAAAGPTLMDSIDIDATHNEVVFQPWVSVFPPLGQGTGEDSVALRNMRSGTFRRHEADEEEEEESIRRVSYPSSGRTVNK